MQARRVAFLLLTTAAWVAVGASACQRGSQSLSSGTASSADQTATGLPAGMYVSDLIAPSDTSYQVTFKWSGVGLAEFIWRQAGSDRRFDTIIRDVPTGKVSGQFALEHLPTSGAQIETDGAITSCLWFSRRGSAEATVSCVPGNSGPLVGTAGDVVWAALEDGRLLNLFPDRTILGHDAACYGYNQVVGPTATVCIDRTDRLPLYFSSFTLTGGAQELIATSAAIASPTVAMPTDVPFETNATPVSAVRPLADLALPNLPP